MYKRQVYISGKEQDVVTLRFGNAPLGSLLITKVSDDAVSYTHLCNGIARFQRVQVLEVIPCAPVVCRKAAVSIPETCIFEMPHAFAAHGAVRSLIHQMCIRDSLNTKNSPRFR